MTLTANDVHNLLLDYSIYSGEGVSERLHSTFDGIQNEYLDFLVVNGYITYEQKVNWLKYRYEHVEYTSMDAMTFTVDILYPYELASSYGLYNNDSTFNYDKANKLGLLNTPVFIKESETKDFILIYENEILKIMSKFIHENLDSFVEVLYEMVEESEGN